LKYIANTKSNVMHAREVIDDKLLTRLELAHRWKVSIDTLRRRERTKILRPVRLDGRLIRYRMSDVLRIEEEGCGDLAEL
jgi:hypothetical protein